MLVRLRWGGPDLGRAAQPGSERHPARGEGADEHAAGERQVVTGQHGGGEVDAVGRQASLEPAARGGVSVEGGLESEPEHEVPDAEGAKQDTRAGTGGRLAADPGATDEAGDGQQPRAGGDPPQAS